MQCSMHLLRKKMLPVLLGNHFSFLVLKKTQSFQKAAPGLQLGKQASNLVMPNPNKD